MGLEDPINTAKPYKGPYSYQAEDAPLFFGRDREASEVVAKVLSSHVALLHSQSGAGKTSLLNAMVIPELERRGRTPVRVLPQNDPISSICTSVLAYVLPPPAAETFVFERFTKNLIAPGEDPTLAETLNRYDALPLKDDRKRSLISPVKKEFVSSDVAWLAVGSVVPYLCRLFRASIDVGGLDEHLSILQQGDMSLSKPLHRITASTRISKVGEILFLPELQDNYLKLMGYLTPPYRGLREFMENLVAIYGKRRSKFGLVLILDQFEELFTRFVDRGGISSPDRLKVPDWRLRYDLFDELERLHLRSGPTETAAGGDSSQMLLPVCSVISMRSEYTAQLGPLRAFVPDLDHSSYHLQLLDLAAAEKVIKQPAAEFGYGYSEECYDKIIKDLSKEDRFIESGHLSLVCEKLWNEKGRELFLSSAAGVASRPGSKIELDLYQDTLKGATGIMRAFLRDFLEETDKFDPGSRLETLEMLEPLITTNNTRNIEEYEQLINAPFRNAERRRKLLSNLVQHTIVRVETRLGGQFVEITHEFLIPPVQEAIREWLYRDLEYTRFRFALGALGRLAQSQDPGRVEQILSTPDFDVLHARREALVWPGWAIELMFRAAILFGKTIDTIQFWAQNITSVDWVEPELTELLSDFFNGKTSQRPLSLSELRKLNRTRDRISLTAEQVELVFRSQLLRSQSADTQDIRYWTNKFVT